ncbi:hypothetical protein PS918_05773 [Pseudomonas fluorescens]|uniref:Uncharacterized protein n=1 Tax=Pseudomonas fluorescens TaxID=294 RepID=A0A5E7UW48_PSEFL|nr:hypothetical protein PS918_05773 [Pseudomonas fluorescens]
MSPDNVMVGGQTMLPSKDIVDNAVNSSDHTMLVAAGKLDMATLAGKIKVGGGKAELTTVAGGKLWAMRALQPRRCPLQRHPRQRRRSACAEGSGA